MHGSTQLINSKRVDIKYATQPFPHRDHKSPSISKAGKDDDVPPICRVY